MKIKCANNECRVTFESDTELMYCSIECACYDGVYNVNTGYNQENLDKKKRELINEKERIRSTLLPRI